ncbi:MAG: efflux RND transporter periplasmic adaptor subunit, partial [Tsuneonella sp.]
MNYETTVQAEPGGVVVDEVIVDEDGRTTRRGRMILFAVLAAIAIAVLLFLTHGNDDKQDFATPAAGTVPVVTVVSPGRTTIAGTIEATGSLAARRPIPVGSVGEGGRVLSVPVDAGDWVRQGQVLAVVDQAVQNQQIAGARAQIGVAQADLELAQANLDRALKLVGRGFISKADVDR